MAQSSELLLIGKTGHSMAYLFVGPLAPHPVGGNDFPTKPPVHLMP